MTEILCQFRIEICSLQVCEYGEDDEDHEEDEDQEVLVFQPLITGINYSHGLINSILFYSIAALGSKHL